MDFWDRLVTDKRKFWTIVIPGVCLVLLAVYGGIKGYNYPGRCAICHSMKPEYYTWQASAHGQAGVVCVSCHTSESLREMVQYKIKGAKEIYDTVTRSYVTPIRILDVVKDSACEKCHDISKIEAASDKSANLNMPHQAHKQAMVTCAKCHNGMAHGHIADRKVTYEADFARWSPALGKEMMSDPGAVGLQMETCIRCHELRNVTKQCNSCHPAGKQPPSHSSTDFKDKTHGQLARQSLKECDSCHSFSSQDPVEMFKEEESFRQFLNQQKSDGPKNQEASQLIPYTRTNTFCRECHAKRPPSHGAARYEEAHGQAAKVDGSKCAVCHDNNVQTGPGGGKLTQAAGETVTLVACISCHPSTHSRSLAWQKGYHPGYKLPNPLKINRSCYDCHNEQQCGSCHGMLK